MKSVYYLVLIAVLLASCSTAPSENTIQTAIAQTQIAQPTNTLTPSPTVTPTTEPTNTPTQIPLSNINLDDILIKPGDLPAGFTGGQIDDTLPEDFTKPSFPKADLFIAQELVRNGDVKGRVLVLLYTNADDIEQAYRELTSNLGSDQEQVQNLGDQAVGLFNSGETNGVEYQIAFLFFTRCHAVVEIYGIDKYLDIPSLSIYARRLIVRMDPLVCR
jgi:hypothetical protein